MTYRGITIDRIAHSGMYRALIIGYGYVRADTLAGIKGLIRDALDNGKPMPTTVEGIYRELTE